MKPQQMKRSLFQAQHYWMLWLMGTTLIYWYVQDTLRPAYEGTGWGLYFLGIAPNYLPGLGLPAGLYVILHGLRTEQSWIARWSEQQLPWLALGISMLGLMGWEVAQIWVGGVFDWHDLLWTALGGLTFVGLWWLTPVSLRHLQDKTSQERSTLS